MVVDFVAVDSVVVEAVDSEIVVVDFEVVVMVEVVDFQVVVVVEVVDSVVDIVVEVDEVDGVDDVEVADSEVVVVDIVVEVDEVDDVEVEVEKLKFLLSCIDNLFVLLVLTEHNLFVLQVGQFQKIVWNFLQTKQKFQVVLGLFVHLSNKHQKTTH